MWYKAHLINLTSKLDMEMVTKIVVSIFIEFQDYDESIKRSCSLTNGFNSQLRIYRNYSKDHVIISYTVNDK
jgi:hypothetical protein